MSALDLSKLRMKGDPPLEPSPEEVKMMETGAKEHQELRDARLAILDAWNWLENSLVEVLRTAVGTPDPIVASVLYFTPHSFRTRLDTIEKIVNHLVVSGVKDPDLASDWRKLAEKMRRKRDVRNLASHGHIITYAEPSGKNHALLAPVMNQMDKYLDAYRDSTKPGATLQEVRDAIGVADRLKKDVEAYHARLKTALGAR